MKQSRHLRRADPFLGAFIREVLQPTVSRGSAKAHRAARFKSGLESSARVRKRHTKSRKDKNKVAENSVLEFYQAISRLISVISLSSNSSVPYTNYSRQQLNVFIPFCLLYYSTFILLFSPHLFTRIKAYSDRIIPLHNKNKSQRSHTHHSHSKSTAKL